MSFESIKKAREPEAIGSIDQAEYKRQRMNSRQDWFHSLDLGDGVITPGKVPVEYEQHLFGALQIPQSLAGMRVLDIGTYDGLYAFECERRGALEVVAIDVTPIDTYCFALASELLTSRVKYLQMSVYELDPAKLGGPFDLVLFPGVFYHLRHILMSFDNIWNILKPTGMVLVETHVCDQHLVLADGSVTTLADIDLRLVDVPLFRFYRKNELNPLDWSNWFGANVAAVLDVMRSAGFETEHLASWQSRAAFRGIKNPAVPREWELGSYEGMRFSSNPDGTWTVIWYDPRTRSGVAL
jgi:tRNA (mo5U34)-methyltransferase